METACLVSNTTRTLPDYPLPGRGVVGFGACDDGCVPPSNPQTDWIPPQGGNDGGLDSRLRVMADWIPPQGGNDVMDANPLS